MRKFSSYLISIFLITLFSTSVLAGQNERCDPQKAPGVTKGLYGLCIAYLASGSTNQALVDKYNLKKSPSDPVMPGTDDDPLGCPCWSTLAAEELGTTPEVLPFYCVLGPEVDFNFPSIDFIWYYSESGDQEILTVDALGTCSYSNTATGAIDPPITGLDADQINECRLDILELADQDFGEIGCIVSE